MDTPEAQPITARSDPAAFMLDPVALADFVERLRASGVRSFAHPSGLQVTFEGAPAKAHPGW